MRTVLRFFIEAIVYDEDALHITWWKVKMSSTFGHKKDDQFFNQKNTPFSKLIAQSIYDVNQNLKKGFWINLIDNTY